jgi:hypothetical protein
VIGRRSPVVDTAAVNTDELSSFVQRHMRDNSGDQLAGRTMLWALANRLLLSNEAGRRMTEAEIGEEMLKLLAYPYRGAPGYDLAWAPAT